MWSGDNKKIKKLNDCCVVVDTIDIDSYFDCHIK